MMEKENQYIETNNKVEKDKSSNFDEQKEIRRNEEIQKEKEEDKVKRDQLLAWLMSSLMDNSENKERHEKVENFIRKNCSEPIPWINKVIPFRDLVKLMIKSAEEENLPEVKKSIQEWNAKDSRIYELPVYKNLLEEGFILPSDNRSYKNEQYHLWVDYTVKAWTKIESIYDWIVVASWLDGGLWHRVILEHTMPDWTKFYSLYAHMWNEWLPQNGSKIKKWDSIGNVWKAFTVDNWDWEEHLHFQIMEEMDSPKWYSNIAEEWNYDVLNSFWK